MTRIAISPRLATRTFSNMARESIWRGRSAIEAECGSECRKIGRPEDHAILRRDVDEIEVDPRAGDLASQISQHAGTVLDVHDDHLALTGDRDMGCRQCVPRGLAMPDKNVKLGALPGTDAGGRCDVHASVTDRRRHLGERPRRVLDLDD